MIIEHNGKRLAFGMNWKSRLSEGDVHRDARAAKSRYFWYADKAFYFGLMPESDAKQKLKAPLYAGAIALLNAFPDVPNLVMVLTLPAGTPNLPEGGYVVCAVQQSRPRNGFDAILQTEVEVSEMLKKFQHLCGTASFQLYGDVRIGGIQPATLDDLAKGADQTALLRKTKSALVNPLAALAAGTVIVGVVGYGYHAYTDYKKAEAQRRAMASQKNAQQLYIDELSARRLDATVLAKDVLAVLDPLRAMEYSLGGWSLAKASCNLPSEKQMSCTFDYQRKPGSKATYQTFVAVAKGFDNVDFAGGAIKATKIFKSLPFAEQGKAIDVAKTEREEVIEFGSRLQNLESVGKPTQDKFAPFAVPAAANVGELTSPPITTAKWELTSPFRNMKLLASFPGYVTITQLVVTYTDKPAYEPSQSLAMVTVTGNIFSKPN